MTIIDQILDYVGDQVGGLELESAYFIDLNTPHSQTIPSFLLDDFVISVRKNWPNIFEEGDYDSAYMTYKACCLIIEYMLSQNLAGVMKMWSAGSEYTFLELYNQLRAELRLRVTFRQDGETEYCALTGVLLNLRPQDDNEIISNLTLLSNRGTLSLEEYQWLLTISNHFWKTDKDGQELLQKIFRSKIDDGSIYLKKNT